jgi:hypothetical protein
MKVLLEPKEVLQKEKGRRLCYIYPYSASSVRIWHPPRTVREKGSERGNGRGMEKGIRDFNT